MLMTPICPKTMASPRAMRRRTQKVLRPLKACIAQIAAFMRDYARPDCTEGSCPPLYWGALGKRIGLDEVRLVDDLVLPIELRLADAQLAPQVVIRVDLHVALG